MTYFANSEINKLYAHTALQGFAEHVGGIFVFVYLLKQGLTAPVVFLALAGFALSRLVFRRAVVPLTLHIGLRGTAIAGALLIALAYLSLAFVDGLNVSLLIFIGLYAWGESWYWPAMHANSASKGDNEQRGAQVSATQVIYAVNGIIGPLVGGFMLTRFGPLAAFSLPVLAQCLSTLPLMLTSNQKIAAASPLKHEDKSFAQRIYFTDAIGAALNGIGWNMALFALLGASFESFGFAMAAAATVGAIASLFVGRLIDLGHGKKATLYSYLSFISVVLIRAAFVWSPVMSLVSNALGWVNGPIFGSVYNSRVYNVAKQSGDPLRFHVAGEGGWDVGCATASLFGAALLAFGASWSLVLFCSLAGTIGSLIILSRSYDRASP